MKTLCAALVVALIAPTAAFAQTPPPGNGVPISGFPNADERLVLVFVNRARADPQTELAGCGSACGEAACYQPTTPVVWAYELNRSARFHSANMRYVGFAHDSQCELVSDISQHFPPNGTCNGDAPCACVGGVKSGTTAWSTRIGMFGGSPGGENIALGYGSPRDVFYAWLYEPDSDPTCGFRFSNGHRKNILENGPALGVGGEQSSWTQDFGYGTVTHDKLVAGANEDSDFYANWYDAQGGGPTSARVNVDGACTAMTLERGTQQNGTWKTTVSGAGCRHYTFEFVDSAGALHVLPETGAYETGCSADYDPAAFAHCGQPPIVDAGTPPTSVDAGADAGSNSSADAGTQGGSDAGSGSSDAGAPPSSGGIDAGAGGSSNGSPASGQQPGAGSGGVTDDPAAHPFPNTPIEGTIGCAASPDGSGASMSLFAAAAVFLFIARSTKRRRSQRTRETCPNFLRQEAGGPTHPSPGGPFPPGPPRM